MIAVNKRRTRYLRLETAQDVPARRILEPAFRLIREPQDKLVDRYLGIETRDLHVFRELGRSVGALERLGYPERSINYTVAFWGMRHIRPRPSDTLLDLGCGSGRLICVAAQFAFRRILGVEINPRLAALTGRNLSTLRKFKARPEVVCADAATFTIPDDVNVVWMYNPFHGAVFESALKRITESYDRKSRQLRILYYNPQEEDTVILAGRFRQTGTYRLWPYSDTWFRRLNVYEVAP